MGKFKLKRRLFSDTPTVWNRSEHMKLLHQQGRYAGTSKIGLWNVSDAKRQHMAEIYKRNALDKNSFGYGSEHYQRLANRTLLHNKFQGEQGYLYFLKFPKSIKVDKITVRDVNSQKLLENWSINAELVKDSVFDIDVPKTEKTGRIGIQLRQFKGVNKEFLNRLSDYISENFNGRIIDVISLQDSMDFDICNTFANLLKNRGFEVNLKNGLNMLGITAKTEMGRVDSE